MKETLALLVLAWQIDPLGMMDFVVAALAAILGCAAIAYGVFAGMGED